MNGANLEVTVTARQPLALGTSSEVSYFTDSHRFIPGSVLRGALAAAWIAESGPPGHGVTQTLAFRAMFDGDIRFGPLHPAGGYRQPLSVLRCKYPIDDRCRAVVDAAFDEATVRCAGCGEALEASKGEYVLPDRYAMKRTTRTAIDPATMRAKDGHLFARAALPAGTVLHGTIHGSDPWLAGPRSLRLGGRRSVGGAANYSTRSIPASAPARAATTVVIRLTSPGIFVDAAGRPRLEPDPDLDLAPGVRIERSWTRRGVTSGWHAASRLSKPHEVCAAAGSTYRLVGGVDDLDGWVRHAAANGIGMRRAEGFGIAEFAAGPWTPPEPTVAAPTEAPADVVRERLGILTSLNVNATETRWLISALRSLQIARYHTQPETGDTLEVLLAQPTPARLTGPQRQLIRDAVAGLDADQLRDLTTLAANRINPSEAP